MSDFQVMMPKMGESVQEATITKMFVKKGDTVEEDDVLFEIATDKVDSEIPSPVAGKVKEIKYNEDDLVAVGEVVMLISMDGEDEGDDTSSEETTDKKAEEQPAAKEEKSETPKDSGAPQGNVNKQSGRFYSPLVRSIADKEGVSFDELESIEGSGQGGRVQKKDILAYLENRGSGKAAQPAAASAPAQEAKAAPQAQQHKVSVSIGAEDTIVEMDRVRKMIADHMVTSKHVAPHVTSVVEADMTNMVLWRNKVKGEYQEKYGEKITFMPLITEAVAKALAEFPYVNSSVDGYNIVLRKHVNIGMAVATENNNLVVPVIKDADTKNLLGLTKDVNRLAALGRKNNLGPDDLQGGTFAITNFGSFGNIIGTPIINQPQTAILAVGTIEKKPAVMETPTGDAIVVRHKMFLSLSYDHRVIDGMLGGKFLRRVADILEEHDPNREI
ncbi:dihydrolipoamide acetyltransferase family protein [Prolixibacter denitrificans]|uniref:Dihydrolipoamide acetyltransferase component of pyruvate dehydrogenase complex n=1 Tax=Prolixibacter denitrificans TaxID=1541063 RepID=A0A2P8CAG1_9BACT|nr:dihydrolipoamide acetyltransferase family protein [Prolixibacter denitrificans]PSK81956.1 2-oxoglutarate dehydrogenase E2 component (dihydrolipoamide succinyltransferase) [Prolixibacter denitrificans]GET22553.1 dihydrolipoamide acetyltransferase component of pyruvate dehydrogenase complex [Prolixibacter denitrificans]